MSRSKRKTPITGITTCESEKQDKRKANRKLRRKTREEIKKGNDTLPLLREVSNVWDFGKDGKWYLDIKSFGDHFMRK